MSSSVDKLASGNDVSGSVDGDTNNPKITKGTLVVKEDHRGSLLNAANHSGRAAQKICIAEDPCSQRAIVMRRSQF
jgi:hypothetical protein